MKDTLKQMIFLTGLLFTDFRYYKVIDIQYFENKSKLFAYWGLSIMSAFFLLAYIFMAFKPQEAKRYYAFFALNIGVFFMFLVTNEVAMVLGFLLICVSLFALLKSDSTSTE